MGPKMIKKQEVELDLITLATTKLPYSLKQGDTNVHEITLKLDVEEGFEYERAQVHYSNGDYQDIEGLTFIIKNSVLKTGIRSFEVEFVANEEIRRSGKVEYRVDSSINSKYEAYDKYNELKKLYDVYVDAVGNEVQREQLKVELIELKNSIESDLENINLAVDDIVSSEDDRKQNEIVREQVRIELENLVADIQNKLDEGDFVGEKGDPGEVTQVEFDNLSQEVTAHKEDYANLEGLVTNVVDGEIQAVLNDELIATDIANKLNAKETEYAPRLTSVEAHLAQKANQSFVDAQFSSIVSGAPKGTYTSLSALQSAYPTGAEGIFLVIQNGHWYYWNGASSAWTDGGVYQSDGISDRSIQSIKIAEVEPYKVKGIIASQNLLNPDTLLTGYTASSGGVGVNASYTLSDFIEIYGGMQYTVSYATALFVTYYDSNKNYLSSASLSTPTTNHTFTVPPNATHMRLNIINTKKSGFMVVSGSVMPSEFIPYSFIFSNLEMEEKAIKLNHLEDALQEKINLFSKSVNLLNPDTITTGMAVASSVGPSANADYDISDFIGVKPDTKYTLSGAVSVAAVFYNSIGTYLGSVPISGANVTITSKPNSATMRINIHKKYKTNFMAVEGDALPDYFIPYGNVVEKLVLDSDAVAYNNLNESLRNAVNNRWASKKIVTFGDSITDIDGDLFSANKSEAGQIIRGYQTHMRERLGCVIDNRGMNGMDMPRILTNRVLPYAGYADTDAVTLTSGANDHRLGVLPGIVLPPKSVFDENTFAGAMQRAIEHILTQNPNIKIFLLTPIKGWFTSTVEARYKGDAVLSAEYVDIMFEIAELYSLPILDWYHTSGINDLTYQINGVPYYIGDVPELVDPQDAYFVHPTNSGYERMADVLIPFLNNNI